MIFKARSTGLSARILASLLLISILLPVLASTASAQDADDLPDKTELPIDDLGSVDIIGEEELTRTSPEMIEYDRQVAEAMVEADRLTANALRADPEAVPIPPRLPELPTQKDGEILKVIPSQIVTPPPANEAASSGSRSQAAASGGYQTDATAIPQNLPAGTYAFDYYLWLGTPKSNDDNRCDGVNYGAGSVVPGGSIQHGLRRGGISCGPPTRSITIR